MPTLGTATVNLTAETASFKAAMREAAATTRETAQEMRASMYEARGAITLLGEEVGVRLPRHLRNFVATLPGVAPLMSAAFSSVAVAGLGLIVFETGKKIYEFISSLGELKKAEKELHDSVVKNAKEELQFQTALVKASYELAKSKATTPQEKQSLNVQEDVALFKLDEAYRVQLRKDRDDMMAAQKSMQETAAAARSAATSSAAVTYAPAMALGANWAASISSKKSEAWQKELDQRNKDIALADAALTSEQAKLNEDLNRINETGAKDAESAVKKAAAAQMKLWEEQLKQTRADHVMSLDEEHSFWMLRVEPAKTYTENYQAVMDKLLEITGTAQVQLQSEQLKFDNTWNEMFGDGLKKRLAALRDEVPPNIAEGMDRAAKDQLAYLKQQQDFAARAIAPGGEAAMQDMAQQLNYLNELKGTESDTLGVEMARKQLLQQIAALENQQVLATGSILDGMKVWLNEVKTNWASAAEETRQLFTKVWDGIGNNLAQMLVTGKAHWADFFKSIADELAKLAINKLFSALLNNLTGGAGGGFLSNLMNMFGGMKASGGDLDAGHFYIAGEAGPEIISGVNGRAFDSGTSAKMLGGGQGAMYYVDARGTNPADTEARMQQALIAVHGSAVRTSYGVVQEAARRRPLSMQTA